MSNATAIAMTSAKNPNTQNPANERPLLLAMVAGMNARAALISSAKKNRPAKLPPDISTRER
jgi:hypothetical protein